jgi:hypothetical protein
MVPVLEACASRCLQRARSLLQWGQIRLGCRRNGCQLLKCTRQLFGFQHDKRLSPRALRYILHQFIIHQFSKGDAVDPNPAEPG